MARLESQDAVTGTKSNSDKEEGVKYNGLTLASLKRTIVHENELYRAVCILLKALFTMDQIRDWWQSGRGSNSKQVEAKPPSTMEDYRTMEIGLQEKDSVKWSDITVKINTAQSAVRLGQNI